MASHLNLGGGGGDCLVLLRDVGHPQAGDALQRLWVVRRLLLQLQLLLQLNDLPGGGGFRNGKQGCTGRPA